MKKVSGVLIIVMLCAVTLLQCAECQQTKAKLGTCFDRARKALTNMRRKLDVAEDGSFSVKPGVTGLKTGCPYVRTLDKSDCRCLTQENIRSASVVDTKDLEMLEFLELLNTDTQIATSCKIQNNVDCSAAADEIIRFKFPEATNLENGLKRRYRTCADRAKKVVPSCQSFIDTVQQTNSSETVMQGGDAAQKACCDALWVATLDEDCLCLILEDAKVNPNAPKPAIEKQMIEVLKFVNADEGRTRDCVSKTNKLDCSGVVKALKRAGELQGNADNGLSDPKKCDEAAVDAIKMCTTPLDTMGPGNANTVESLVCCKLLERIGGAGCACSLGNSVPTSKNVVGFLKGIRSTGDKLVESCPGFKLDGVLNCAKATDKNAKLFDKCELDAQEAMKTCAPLAKKAVPEQTVLPSCETLENFPEDPCACAIQDYCSREVNEGNYKFCESFRHEYYMGGCYDDMKNDTQFVSSCVDKFNATSQACADEKAQAEKKPKVDPIKPCCPPGNSQDDDCVTCDSETMSCCQQLAALSASSTGEVNSCLCQVVEKRVTGRTDTAVFLKANGLRGHTSAVSQTCDFMLQTYDIDCVRVSGASGTDPRLAAYLYQQEASNRRLRWKLTH